MNKLVEGICGENYKVHFIKFYISFNNILFYFWLDQLPPLVSLGAL